MVTAASMTPQPPIPASGARLYATDGKTLPLRSSALAVEARGGIARTVLTQRFVNEHDRPLEVTYQLPLPADGAVSGFRFVVDGEVIVGEVDRKADARARYDAALAAGQSAALLEQTRANTFTQKVGNIPPNSEIVCEVAIDQRLVWVAGEGQWEWRFPTVVGPRYAGEAGRVKDAAALVVDVADRPLPTTLDLEVAIQDAVLHDREPESPSHSVTTARDGLVRRVRLAAGAALDRDLVVRWPVAAPEVGMTVAAARPLGDAHEGRSYGLLTVVPPDSPERAASVPRDLVFLIDTSGSMGGRPLDQAKRVLSAMIDSLVDVDRIEMIEYSNRPSRWKRAPVAATRDGKRAATKWLNALEAGGGTEMKTGLLEAIAPLREGAQRQVVLVTDGYIGFEDEIVRTVLERMPRSCRLHTVGVGSAPNEALLKPVARAGGGVALSLALDEDPERGARRLVAKTARPLVTELRIRGVERAVPATLPDLYAASPALVAVELPIGGGVIEVEGVTADGPVYQRLEVPALALGEGPQAVVNLFGREWVEDLEALRCAGGDRRDVDDQVERVGLDFQIATRRTSWIAVREEGAVDRSRGTVDETMPHALPYGVSAEGFGLRPAAPVLGRGRVLDAMSAGGAPVSERARRVRTRGGPTGRAEEGAFADEEVLETIEADDDFEGVPVTAAPSAAPFGKKGKAREEAAISADEAKLEAAAPPPARSIAKKPALATVEKEAAPRDLAKRRRRALILALIGLGLVALAVWLWLFGGAG